MSVVKHKYLTSSLPDIVEGFVSELGWTEKCRPSGCEFIDDLLVDSFFLVSVAVDVGDVDKDDFVWVCAEEVFKLLEDVVYVSSKKTMNDAPEGNKNVMVRLFKNLRQMITIKSI